MTVVIIITHPQRCCIVVVAIICVLLFAWTAPVQARRQQPRFAVGNNRQRRGGEVMGAQVSSSGSPTTNSAARNKVETALQLVSSSSSSSGGAPVSSTTTKQQQQPQGRGQRQRQRQQLSSATQVLQSCLDRTHSSTPSSSSSSSPTTPSLPPPSRFEIHGWRWHTLSVMRDATRLSRALRNTDREWTDPAALHRAARFVVQFHVRGLHRIETQIFFPWLRRELPYYYHYDYQYQEDEGRRRRDEPAPNNNNKKDGNKASLFRPQQQQQQKRPKLPDPRQFRRALNTVVSQLESQQESIRQLGVQLMSTMSTLTETNALPRQTSRRRRRRRRTNNNNRGTSSSSTATPRLLSYEQQEVLWSTAADQSAQIAQRTRDMLTLESQVLIPLLSQLVPTDVQHELNQKVIAELGLWDSRLHLVSMHQVVYDTDGIGSGNRNDKSNDSHHPWVAPAERQLFSKTIPKLAQRMIPRWKRLLYDPQMSVLEDINSKNQNGR